MVETLHGKELPVHSVVGLIQEGTAGRHPGVYEHRIPADLFALEPIAYTFAVAGSNGGRDVVGKVAEPLAQRYNPQACALAAPVQEGVELRAQTLADWSRHAHQFAWEFVEGMAQAVAQARPRKQGPHTLGRAVKAIGEGTPHAVRRLNLKGRSLKVTIGRGKSGGTFGRAVAQMPEHAATDNRGQIHLVGQTLAVLFIGQDIDGQ